MRQSKKEKWEEWSEANGEMRRRRSDNREKSLRIGEPKRGEDEEDPRWWWGGSAWQQDVPWACQSLTKDQDLCDTSVLNLQQRHSACLCLYLGSCVSHSFLSHFSVFLGGFSCFWSVIPALFLSCFRLKLRHGISALFDIICSGRWHRA